MFRYVLKRIGLMFLSFIIIMTACFFLVKMLPLVVNATLGQDAEIAEAQIVARGYRDPIFRTRVLLVIFLVQNIH